MTPRQLREQIEGIDAQLNQLGPWEQKLLAMRRRYVIEDTDDARWALGVIDHGVHPGAGRPSDPEFEPFDRGLPGLQETGEAISTLKERRTLLVEQLPSKAEMEAKTKDAEARAKDIRAREDALPAHVTRLETTLIELARLALSIAEECDRVSQDNAALDRFTSEADIVRPSTQRPEVPCIPLAAIVGPLLQRHFRGAQAYKVDPNIAERIRTIVTTKNLTHN